MTNRNQQLAAAKLKEVFSEKTDLDNKLSYSGGVKNILGIGRTSKKVRLKIKNHDGNQDALIIFGAQNDLFKDQGDHDENGLVSMYDKIGFNAGGKILSLFSNPSLYDGSANKLLSIESLTNGVDLQLIAALYRQNPTMIRKIRLKSYSLSGNPEATNFGNEMISYVHDFYTGELKKNRTLYLNNGETRRDNNTSVMTIDTVAEGFNPKISYKDFFTIPVNRETVLEVELTIGAEDNDAEYFHRQIEEGTTLLKKGFPEEFKSDAENCGC